MYSSPLHGDYYVTQFSHAGDHPEVDGELDPSRGPYYFTAIRQAHVLFHGFMRLFAYQLPTRPKRDESVPIFKRFDSAGDAFRVVEIELHLIFLCMMSYV